MGSRLNKLMKISIQIPYQPQGGALLFWVVMASTIPKINPGNGPASSTQTFSDREALSFRPVTAAPKKGNSDLAAFSISPIGQRFEDNFKPSLGRNFGTALDGFEQLEPDNRGEQYL